MHKDDSILNKLFCFRRKLMCFLFQMIEMKRKKGKINTKSELGFFPNFQKLLFVVFSERA